MLTAAAEALAGTGHDIMSHGVGLNRAARASICTRNIRTDTALDAFYRRLSAPRSRRSPRPLARSQFSSTMPCVTEWTTLTLARPPTRPVIVATLMRTSRSTSRQGYTTQSSAHRVSRYPWCRISLSKGVSRILLSIGEMTPPCGVPRGVANWWPSLRSPPQAFVE